MAESMKKELSFGGFIKQKRTEKGISIRKMAKKLKISAPYLSDVEKGKRNPFNKDRFHDLQQIFLLTNEELAYMYDLAGKAVNKVAWDISEYIMDNKYVCDGIRAARDCNADEDDWKSFMDRLLSMSGNKNL